MSTKTILGLAAIIGSVSSSYLDSTVSTCCSLLASQLPNTTFPRDTSNSSTYYDVSTSFWSSTEWLSPTCVFLPKTTSDVSTAVAIFSQHDCPFSIRGGGHSAIRGAANIDDGILMTMRNVKDITFSEDKKTVTVGAGNKFAEIYASIEREGYMIAGGRFGTVGTGLLLGAGFSYFINDVGLAVDNVAGHRVVLANGTVVFANETHNPELHWALKGGSNNFGVVTHFELYTIPSNGCYGGRVTYPESSLDQLQAATYEYQVKTAVTDVDVHVLPTFVYDGASNTTYGYTPIAYNKNATSIKPSLQQWIDIPHSNSTLRNRNYASLANELVAGFPDGLVQSHYTFTIYPDAAFLRETLQLWREFCASLKHIPGFGGLQTVMPITPNAISKTKNRGGNPLGLSAAKANTTLTVLYMGLTFNNLEDTEEVFPAWEIFIRSLEARAKTRQLLFPYIMLTYSDHNQQVLQSYGQTNIGKMQEVQSAYDPTLVFQRLVTGGQKLPF